MLELATSVLMSKSLIDVFFHLIWCASFYTSHDLERMIISQSFRWINLFAATLFFKIVQSVQSAGYHLDWRKTKQNCKHSVIDSWYDIPYPQKTYSLKISYLERRILPVGWDLWNKTCPLQSTPTFWCNAKVLIHFKLLKAIVISISSSTLLLQKILNELLFLNFPIFESVIPALLPMFRFPNSCSSI